MVAKRLLFLFFFVKILVKILSRMFIILVPPKLLESNDLIIVVRLDHDNLLGILNLRIVVVHGVGIIQSQPALILLAKDLFNILRGSGMKHSNNRKVTKFAMVSLTKAVSWSPIKFSCVFWAGLR